MRISQHSSVLLHEPLVELLNPAHPLSSRRQERCPEMQRPLSLPKPRTGHNTHSRRLEQLHAVELIRALAILLRSLGRLLWQRDSRE